MSVNSKRVFYVKYLANPIYIDILKARPDVRLDRIENESPEEYFAPIIEAAHVYQIGAARDELAPHFHVDAAFLKRAPNLLLVSSNGAGFDPVDVEACTDAGVLVVNQSGGNAHSVAEHALAMMLTLSKRIIQSDRKLRRESNVNRNELVGNEIEHKTVGIIGLGNVGRRIAALCKGLFGMKVLAYDPYLAAEVMAERGGEKVELDELLRRADFVSISCPLDRGSRNMISVREFALMQPHAYFITTARGFIHDEDALLQGLAREARCGRRSRRLVQGAAAAGASAAPARQRAGEPAYRGRHDRGAAEHGPHRGRAGAGYARWQAAAAHHQSGGLATLCGAIQAGVWCDAGVVDSRSVLPGCDAPAAQCPG
ncbi:D-3-phosphoglycerate dehydrogenase [Bradyrhizobium sp. GM22.5]